MAKRMIMQTASYASPWTSFLLSKTSAKYAMGHSQQWCQINMGWVEIGGFRLVYH